MRDIGKMENCFAITYVCQLDSPDVSHDQSCIQSRYQIRTDINKIGRSLLRYGLRRHFNLGGEDIVLTHGQHGKPYLKNSPLFFNISHSDRAIACCISDKEIGIDIQKNITLSNWNILKSFFSSSELNQVIEADNKSEKFTEIWAMKESYLKMLGVGFNRNLRSFSIIKDGADYRVEDQNEILCRIFLRDLLPDYKIAICSCDVDTRCNVMSLPLNTVRSTFYH